MDLGESTSAGALYVQIQVNWGQKSRIGSTDHWGKTCVTGPEPSISTWHGAVNITLQP